jgi:hypothetical protein
MINLLILGLSIGLCLCLCLARQLLPFIYLGLLTIVVWLGVGLAVVGQAIGVVGGMVRDWFVC